MGGRLVLVRHSAPLVEEGVPQSCWRLSSEGRAAAAGLSRRLRGFDPPTIWSSPEPKAIETAQELAAVLERPIREAPDLREHARTSLGYLGKEQLEAGVERLLGAQASLVFGDETAQAVLARMDRALSAAASAADGRDVVAVTHGTAAAIYVGRRCGVDTLALWRSLGAPAAVVVAGARIERILE